MKIPYAVVPKLRGLTLLAFVALCALIFSFLWTKAGGKIPLVSKAGYQVTVPYKDIDNLVFQSDVRIAGVNVGKVEKIDLDGPTAMVTLELDDEVAPLHEGAIVTLRNKTMIEETFLEITDGDGSKIADGATLPKSSAVESVQLNDMLTSLDAKTRKDLSKTIQSGGAATDGRKADVDAVLTGLGDLGDNAGALEALAQQSEDLKTLVRTSTNVLNALDTQQGRIVDLTRDAQTLTNVTAGHEADVKAVMRALPPLLVTTERASGSLKDLAQPLSTVSRNLKGASGDLNAALLELPATTRDLRGLLPSLNTTLDRAPATLTRLSPFAKEASPLLDALSVTMADLNPMLEYLAPYRDDLITNWSQWVTAANPDANGYIARITTGLGVNSLSLPTKLTPGTFLNPYPKPHTQQNPQPYSGDFPRVEEDKIP